MTNNKDKKNRGDAVPTDLIREFARPRITESARIAETKFQTPPSAGSPSITLAGRVDRIVPPAIRNGAETAQIFLQGSPQEYRDLRIENSLKDPQGEGVELQSGAHVEVTITAKPRLKPIA